MRALITGITGQDGSYLAEWLVGKGYKVYGMVRRVSEPNLWRIRHLLDRVELVGGDLGDGVSINNVVRGCEPDEVYNLAGMSFVGASYSMPEYTMETVMGGAVKVFEAVKRYVPRARVYQASSSEMFGDCKVEIQNEGTGFYPVSPYGVAKVGAHYAAKYYRAVYGMGISCGILFNHESPRRGGEFVTQKICRGLREVMDGKRDVLELGNMKAKRDWGHAKDYVEAMWLMNQAPPNDFVVGTGESYTVEDFARLVCKKMRLDFEKVVKVDPSQKRPGEVPVLRCDGRKAKRLLGWEPSYSFENLVDEMIDGAMVNAN